MAKKLVIEKSTATLEEEYKVAIATKKAVELTDSELDFRHKSIILPAVELKRAELENKRGFTVNSFILYDKNLEPVIGYLEEPHRIVKVQCSDLYHRMQFSQADMIMLEGCLIKEESDAKLTAENPTRDPDLDKLYLGALKVVQGLIKYAADAQKKS